MVSSTPRPHFTNGKDPVPNSQEAGWAPGPVWTGEKSCRHRDSIPDRPARSSITIPTELSGPQGPKHVESYSKNKFEKLMALVGFIIRTGETFVHPFRLHPLDSIKTTLRFDLG